MLAREGAIYLSTRKVNKATRDIREMMLKIRTMNRKARYEKKLYHFQKDDIVEWTERGVRHEGEVLERERGTRKNFFCVRDYNSKGLQVIYGSRLKKTKMRVKFD